MAKRQSQAKKSKPESDTTTFSTRLTAEQKELVEQAAKIRDRIREMEEKHKSGTD